MYDQYSLDPFARTNNSWSAPGFEEFDPYGSYTAATLAADYGETCDPPTGETNNGCPPGSFTFA